MPSELCRKETVDKLQLSLEREFGKPDSITIDKIPGNSFQSSYNDTTFWYHASTNCIKLTKGQLNRPVSGFNSYYYRNPKLTFYQKNYSKNLSALIARARESLRPADVVSILVDVNKQPSMRHPENGSYYPAIQVVPRKPFATSPLETRAITAIGGSLSFTDRFGGELYTVEDYEFRPYKPIQYTKYSLVLEAPASSYGDNFNLYLLPGRREIAKLREAYMLGKDIKAELTVKAISFEDGSIMK